MQDKRTSLLTRWGELKAERSDWIPHWREIGEVMLPRAGRYFVQDRNKGTKRHHQIYDNTGLRGLEVLGAGMMAGMTSPARPWFKLSTADPDLAKYQPVKVWLQDVTTLMQTVFRKSNTYRALHTIYKELGAFGTAGSVGSADFNTIIHHTPLTAGEYAIATDFRGNVTTLYREFQKPVGEIVAEFGIENVSNTVKHLYLSGSLGSWITLVHAIEPRTDRDPRKRDSKNMPWLSCYFELGAPDGKYLRESGYKYFRGLCPRWDVAGGDIYGHSPGMNALGDVRQLQHEQLRKGQVIDYKTKPPLQVPTALKNQQQQWLPGGITYVDSTGPGQGVRSAFEVNLDLSHLLEDIQDVRGRIREAFYADLFLMLANSTRTNMTATEVAERHEEKLLMLGPVLERLHNELLDPLIENTFSDMLEAGIVPPPPEEMGEQDLQIEFVSMLAQAQRAVQTNSVDRYITTIGAIAQSKPDVLDKIDTDYIADAYADMLGVDPQMVVGNERVALIRQQRAQAAAQQQDMEAAQAMAGTAKDLARVGPEPSALTNVIDMFSGY